MHPKGLQRGFLCVGLVAAFLRATVASDFELSRGVVVGGAIHVTSGDGSFELSGTIGQAISGPMTDTDFTLTGGFWFELVPGDCNDDGATSSQDYHSFVSCLTDPGADPSADCMCFDFDEDDDLDLSDFARFQNTFNAP